MGFLLLNDILDKLHVSKSVFLLYIYPFLACLYLINIYLYIYSLIVFHLYCFHLYLLVPCFIIKLIYSLLLLLICLKGVHKNLFNMK